MYPQSATWTTFKLVSVACIVTLYSQLVQVSSSSRRSVTMFRSVYRHRQKHLMHAMFVFLTTLMCASLVEGATKNRQNCPNECGSQNPNGNVIDLSEPSSPGPFHDLTSDELRNLRTFLENDPNIRAVKSSEAKVDSSYIYMADLFVAPKRDVLEYLDNEGPQPPRQARVMMFRGDLSPPVVEEYICGPLGQVQECSLLNFPNRRNPVEFSLRPMNDIENIEVAKIMETQVERELGYILRESYGTSFTNCEEDVCLIGDPSPYGTGLVGDINRRLFWVPALFDVPYNLLHPVDFAMLFNLDGADVTQWKLEKVWYAGVLYDCVDDLIRGYNSSSIPVERIPKPVYSSDLFSTLHRRGKPVPKRPQRPPTLVEPDGKRYSVKDRKIEYLDWTFHFRTSPFSGPVLYDVRFQGQRIAYELGLNEIAVYYSGISPASQNMDYIDSGLLLGSRSKSLVPGGDCPDTATLISNTVMSQYGEEPAVYDAAFCLFEQNNGYPLRRHLSYERASGAFYGGMLDTALILRTALTIVNYDYIIDFMFHQNGVVETRFMSTGYILATSYTDKEKSYGLHIQEHIMGSLHNHIANFKVDIDVHGTSNRYETLDFVEEKIPLTTDPSKMYSQTRFERNLKRTEKEALLKYNFDQPKYHLVHNENNKTKYGEMKSYRIQLNGMSKQLIAEGFGNERTTAWARQQLTVTKRKEEEFCSSSNYGMSDSLNPVVDFSTFYEDDENIVDEDLVFWISCGMHHLPHTEDLPVTPTVGNHLSFFLLPYNYFPECPSMGSRDAIFIDHKNPSQPEDGVKVERNGNSREQCITPEVTLEENLEANPDQVLESIRPNPTGF